MRRFWRDGLCVAGLLLLPLLLFAPVVLGGKTLLPADALFSFEPYRAAADALDVGAPQNPLLLDLILENYPWKQFLVDAVRGRRLPLWDPYLFSGHPFLANGQHSALYPFTWLFFLLPIPRAFGVFVALHLGLAGVSMYVLARTLTRAPASASRAGRVAALLAGITFQFSGFLVVSVVHPMIVAAAVWLPLLLALVDLTVRRASAWQQRTMLPWALLGAVVLGLQVLAGHAEATYFSLLVMGAFGLWRLLHTALTRPRRRWRAEVLSPALGLALMVTLGLALGTVQLLPLYEVVRTSFRQDAVTLSEVLGWAYPKRRILTFLVPNFFGNPTHRAFTDIFTGETVRATVNAYGEPISAFDWGIKNYVEGGAYLGILPLLLATIAVLRPPGAPDRAPRGLVRRLGAWLRHPYVPFFTGLSLFSLACIFGTPVYALVYALPLLSQSHSPFRWVFPLTVAVAALAGLGATRVIELRRTRPPEDAAERSPAPSKAQPDRGAGVMRRVTQVLLLDTRPNVVSVVAALAIWGGAGMLAGLWASRLLFRWIAPVVEKAFWSLALAAHTFPDHRAWYAYLFPWIQNAALFLIGAGIVVRVSRCPIYLPRRLGRRPVWEALAVVVLVVDLVTFGAGFNPAVDPALLAYTPPVVEFLRQDQGLWRFSTFDPHGRKTFLANTGMFYGFQDVRGYDSLFSAQYARYMGWIEPQGELPYNRIAPFTQLSSLDSPLTDLLNVKYIVTEEEIALPKYEQVYRDAAVRVYENLGVMPRAFTLPTRATLPVPDAEAVGEVFLAYDPRFYALVEAPQLAALPAAPDVTTPEPGTPQAQSVVTYGPNEVLVEATVDGPAWLILADTYAPGWKAFVRPPGAGKDQETEVPILRVAGNFRGVLLAESGLVRFKYSPNSVKIGAFVAFLGGMTGLFLAGLWLWRRVYRERGDASTVQRVAKNSVTPIVLTTFNRALEFAFAALMLRVLGPGSAGDYYLAGSIYIWFDILTNFGLNTYLTREVARRPEQARRYLLNTTALRLALSVLAVPLLAGFIGLRQTVVAGLTAPASGQAMLALGLLYVGLIPNSISTGISALFYAFEKAEYPAAITSVSTLLRVTFQVLTLLAGWGIVGLAGAAIAVNVITLAILATLAWRQFPELRAPVEPALVAQGASARALRREMVRASWPLMLNHLLAMLFFKVDVTLVEALQGSDALGRYSVGYKFVEAINVVPSMFTLALFPVIARQAQDDRASFRRFYQMGGKLLMTLVLPTAVLATLAAHEMVLVLGGPEYLPGARVALQLMAWSMPLAWFNGLTQYVLIALDQQRYLTRAYALAFAFTLIANLFLIPRFGFRASAVLHVASELVLLIPFVLGMRRHVPHIDGRAIIDIVGKPALAALAMGAVALLLLPLGRGVALVGATLAYPLAAWRLELLTPRERALLRPLLDLRSRTSGEPRCP